MVFYQSLNLLFIPGISNTNLINKIKLGNVSGMFIRLGEHKDSAWGGRVFVCMCVCSVE